MKPNPAITLSLILALALIAACGDKKDEPTPEETTLTAIGQKAPDFTVATLDGGAFSLSDHRGRVVLVNWFATWCAPCIEEMPSIQRLAREMHGKPFAVIGVNVGETERRVQATVKRLEIDFPVLLDKNSAVFENWGATVLPTTYVLDGNGRVRYVGRGPLEWDRVDIIDMLGHLTEQQHLPK